jgi:hypothetical protein
MKPSMLMNMTDSELLVELDNIKHKSPVIFELYLRLKSFEEHFDNGEEVDLTPKPKKIRHTQCPVCLAHIEMEEQ